MFRLGYEKGRIWGFYIPVILIAGMFGVLNVLLHTEKSISMMLGWITFWSQNIILVCVIMLAIGAALMYVSYRLSLLLFAKRDF
jgi:hypothetical protein